MDGRIVILVHAEEDRELPAVRHVLAQAQPCDASAALMSTGELTRRLKELDEQPVVVVLGPTLPEPIPAARRLKSAGLDSYFVFAVDPARLPDLRKQLFYSAPPDVPWSLQPADSPTLSQAIQRGAATVQQRRRLRTTLDTINQRLAQRPAFESSRYRELVASDRYLVSILKHAQDAIISLDASGTITSWNRGAESLFGHTRAEAVGAQVTSVLPVDNGLQDTMERTAAGEVVRRELVACVSDEKRYLDAIFSPIEDETHEVTGLALIMRDVTDRKLAEEALKQADQRKNEFLAVLAHELRNPLAPISNALQLLGAPGLDEAQREWSRQVAERQVRHMARLLDDLLDVSRISRGSLKLRKEPVALQRVIEEAIESARPLLEAKEHDLTVRLPREEVVLDGDLARLIQIFGNLLINAAQYTGKTGEITVAAHAAAGTVVVSVKDNGAGIEHAMLPRVFEMFAQLSTGPEPSGTGVGLAITRRLVELHGGRIEARSGGLGRGSEFVVRLPYREKTAAEQPSDDAPVSWCSAEERRILVVDDNVDAADALAMTLELSGYTVKTVYDGPSALECLEGFDPEVVLLDIGMPRMDGCEVARRIRAMPGGGERLLVAVTGWGQEKDRRRTAEAGFDEHVTKPVDYATLMRLVSRRSDGREEPSSSA